VSARPPAPPLLPRKLPQALPLPPSTPSPSSQHFRKRTDKEICDQREGEERGKGSTWGSRRSSKAGAGGGLGAWALHIMHHTLPEEARQAVEAVRGLGRDVAVQADVLGGKVHRTPSQLRRTC
jgi:hypothetical protein